jgi:hypothetical protein
MSRTLTNSSSTSESSGTRASILKQQKRAAGVVSDVVKQVKSYIPESFHVDQKRNYIQEGYNWAVESSQPRIAALMAPLSTFQKVALVSVGLFFLWLPLLIASFFVVPALLFFTLAFYALFLDWSTLYSHTDATVQNAVGVSIAQLPSLLYGYVTYAFQNSLYVFYYLRQFYLNTAVPALNKSVEVGYEYSQKLWNNLPGSLRTDLVSVYANHIYPLGQRTNALVTKFVQQYKGKINELYLLLCSYFSAVVSFVAAKCPSDQKPSK